MTSAHIRFSPDILRRLGEELNPTVDQGILEIVKNSYDADARHCSVELQGADTAGGSIRIVDDGDGMTGSDIVENWLILGRSSKDPRQPTELGRVPVGSKGLGRLAALRMGSEAALVSAPKAEPVSEYALEIEWQRFDESRTVDEVGLDVVRRDRERATSGTTITIRDLKRAMSRTDVRNLARAMVLLADPFGEDNAAFELSLTAPEYADYEKLVANRYFTEADFHLVAQVGVDGEATAAVLDWRGEILYSASHDELSRAGDRDGYDCPPADFDLWAFILSSESFATRQVSVRDVQAWLRAFGGVHFYVNGIRVSPYGNVGNDWLEMNLRRVRSPEERPGTNTSIGRVKVTDLQGLLTQKTDRAGFIEDDAFLELRRFAQDALEWMARRRLETAEKRRTAERSTATTVVTTAGAGLVEEIERAPAPNREALREAYGRYDRARDRETDALRREVQLYRTLSTAGITAANFAHESSGNPLKVISQAVNAIERRSRRLLGAGSSELDEPIHSLRKAAASLGVLSAATLRLIAPNKRRVGRVDLNATIAEVLETFKPFTTGRGVDVHANYAEGAPYLRGTEAAVESIVTNLLNNSMVALEGRRTRKIEVRTRVAEETFELVIEDSGEGITATPVSDIWLPGFTTRAGGTGLGLTIVRDAAADLSGTVAVDRQGQLGGAAFTIRLPILGT